MKGYGDEVLSHLDVASRIRTGLADTGIGVRSVASICGLDFVPLQRERYDLIIPETLLRELERPARPAGHHCEQALPGRARCAGRLRYKGNR